ncbi:hypothetical protein HN935_03365 [archaeon]|jgi:hypothetical protein|nr:hypothetical protein [archaeon]
MANKMKMWQNPGFYIGLIVALVLLYVVWPSGSGEYDEFASCLGESGATMYGTEWCHVCRSQKDLFGDSFDFVNYVDCDRQRDVCLAALVGGYPTWVIGGESYPGFQSFEKLAELSGCELTKDE